MSKHWDYEDDHDWEDDIDYKERGEVYWYGKYYPKDYVDAIYGDNKEQYNNEADENNGGTLGRLGVVLVAGGLGYLAYKVVPVIKDKFRNKK